MQSSGAGTGTGVITAGQGRWVLQGISRRGINMQKASVSVAVSVSSVRPYLVSTAAVSLSLSLCAGHFGYLRAILARLGPGRWYSRGGCCEADADQLQLVFLAEAPSI